MMIIDQTKEFLTTLYKEFGATKFAVASASAIVGAGMGFTVAAIVIPNDPIIDTIVKEN